jgi:hypothetical protein
MYKNLNDKRTYDRKWRAEKRAIEKTLEENKEFFFNTYLEN